MAVFFSIVVPVYMADRYLEATLESVLSQSFSDFELLLMDDGSTDRSPEICAHFATTDSRVRLVSLSHGGVSAARNAGISEALGEYIYFLDSDDTLEPDALRRLYEVSRTRTADIFAFNYHQVKSDGSVTKVRLFSDGPLDKEGLCNYYESGFRNEVWNKLFRTAFLREHNLVFDPDITMGEDLLFVYRCLLNASDIIGVSGFFYRYYVRADSATTRKKFRESDFTALTAIRRVEALFSAGSAPARQMRAYYMDTAVILALRMLYSPTKLPEHLHDLRGDIRVRLMEYLKNPWSTQGLKLRALALAFAPWVTRLYRPR